MSENLIEVKKLVTQFSGKNGTVTAVDGVSFHVREEKHLESWVNPGVENPLQVCRSCG